MAKQKITIEDRILNMSEKLSTITGSGVKVFSGAASLAIYNHKAVAEKTEATINNKVMQRKIAIAQDLRKFRNSNR